MSPLPATAFLPALPPALLDRLAEPLLVFDAALRVAHANSAARRRLKIEPGMALAEVERLLAPAQRERLRAVLATSARPASGVPLQSPSAGAEGAGADSAPIFWRLDARHSALLFPLPALAPAETAGAAGAFPSSSARAGGQDGDGTTAADPSGGSGHAAAGAAVRQRGMAVAPALSLAMGDASLRELHALLWAAPFPAMLQDEVYRLLDVNPAFEAMLGRSRGQLMGRDPLELLDAAGQLATLAERARLDREGPEAGLAAQAELQYRDISGQLRPTRAVRQFTLTADGRRLLLTLMQETTAEHVAREQAERSSRELDQWFDFSPLGLALIDANGLVLRSNTTFDQLVGERLADLRGANPAVRELLRLDEALAPAQSPSWASRHGELPDGGGATRWVRVLLRRYEGRAGQRRVLCVLEDRSAEQLLDLAQHQLGALVGGAGVGIVTFTQGEDGQPVLLSASEPSAAASAGAGEAAVAPQDDGTVAGAPPQTQAPAEPRGAGDRGAALQAIRRELVAPASLPEFERLQRALRLGEACEVRFAIQHPDLGERWLLTRVEPGRLSSGQASVSVVTLDITEQQHAHLRAERLLEELSGILEASTAGIAALRGDRVVQCNRHFERMLGLDDGVGPGQAFSELLQAHRPGPEEGAPGEAGGETALARLQAELRSALTGAGGLYECELSPGAGGPASPLPLMPEGGPGGGAGGASGAATRVWQALSVRRTGGPDEAPHAVVVLTDISRLKAQQGQLEALVRERAGMLQTLAQQADRTRAVLDSVLVGIVTVGLRGEVSWLNRSARRMFGGDLGDFIGQPIAAAATEEADHPLRAAPGKLAELSDGETQQFECRLRGRDGRVFWVVGNVVATQAHHGGRELTYAFLDIDQRRQAEARVTEARESLQRIIEAAPMAIALFDAQGLQLLQLNQAAVSFFELGPNPPPSGTTLAPERLWPRRGGTSLRAQLGVDLRTARQGQAGPPLQREYRLRRTPPGAFADGAPESGPDNTPTRGPDNTSTRGATVAVLEVWDARFLSLARPGEPAGQILMVASDVSAQRAAQRAELEAAIAQREMLVQEVHHRIKNNLQGVAGLLQQIGQKRPEVQPIISEVVGQVQAIAQVYGLQVGGVGPLAVQALIEAIAGSLQRNFGRHIVLYLPPPGAPEQGGAMSAGSAVGGAMSGSLGEGVISPFDLAPVGGWSLPEAESIPIALTLNELITNAIKHSPTGSEIECRLESGAGGVSISIVNGGRLPEGFRIDHRRSSVSGLGLVKSLLPRRHASLHFMQSGELVIATVTLAPPVVRAIRRPASAEPGSASPLSGAATGPDPGAA